MDLPSMFEAGAAGLTLADKLVKIITELRERGELPRLTEAIHRLVPEALEMCRGFSADLRQMRVDLQESGIDTSRSIEDLTNELRWYNWNSRNRLKKYQRRYLNLYQSIATFIDDVTSVLICSGNAELLSNPLVEARQTKRTLDESVSSDNPIDTIIESMLRISDGLVERLQN